MERIGVVLAADLQRDGLVGARRGIVNRRDVDGHRGGGRNIDAAGNGGAAVVLHLEGEGSQRTAAGVCRPSVGELAGGDIDERDELTHSDGVAVVAEGAGPWQ